MSIISQIKEESKSKVSAMFAELGVLFAFSDKQFEEGKKEGVVYVRMEYGMIVPKENVQLLNEGFDRIDSETAQSFRERVPMDDYILHELYNHEFFYTGNYAEVPRLIQNYYPECTLEDVQRVYFENNK